MKKFNFSWAKKQTKSIKGSITDAESRFLYDRALKGLGKGVVVEIGSFCGKSTIFLAAASKARKRGKVIAIDPHQGAPVINKTFSGPTYKEFKKNIKEADVYDYVTIKKTTSDQAAIKWKGLIRILFIDGDHSYQAVKNDLKNYLPYVVDNGLIVLHDALHPGDGPPRAIVENLLSYDFSNMGVVDSMFYCIKKPPETVSEKLNWYFYNLMMRWVWFLLRVSVFIQQQVVKTAMKQMLSNISKKWL